MTWSEKLIYFLKTGSLIYKQIQSYTYALLDLACGNWSASASCFSQPSISTELYEQPGALMVPWKASSELCVPVKSRGAGK